MKIICGHLLLFSCFLANSQTYNKQNTYLDALELTKIYKQNAHLLDSNNRNLYAAFYLILEKYGLDTQNIQRNPFLSPLEIKMYSSIHPILSQKISATRTRRKRRASTIYNQPSSPVAAYNPSSTEIKTSNQAISWEASAINGASTFMASRFKQEVLHIGINQIFAKITNTKDSNLCRYLFPKSFQYIHTLYAGGGQSYYTSDLMVLKQSALMDMENLPFNMVMHSPSLFSKSVDINKTKDILKLSHHFIMNVRNGYALDKLIHSLTNETYSSDSNAYRILNVIDLLSEASLNTSKGIDYWVSFQDLKLNRSIELDKTELRFFYALLYQQLIQIPELRDFISITKSNSAQQSLMKMQQLISIVEQLNQIHDYIKNHNFKLNSVRDFNNYLTLYLKALASFNQTMYELGDEKMRRTMTIASQEMEICTKYFNIVDAVQARDMNRVIPIFIAEFGPSLNQSTENLRTLAFISQLSSIQTSDDMENLLKANALPIGGASIKRNSQFNVSFNGYVGLTSGAELALASQQIQVKPNLGLAAPIGISVTGHHHLTYFFSFLDLGSIVNQRFGNDTASYAGLKLEHFFTPGLGVFYNFKKLPVSIGLHSSYISNLRTIKYQYNNALISESNVSVVRVNFSLLIDIPFLTLYNQGFKGKKR